MDFALCNCGGMLIGMKTCELLSLKHYNWFHVSKEKVQSQLLLITFILATLVAESNLFYMKFILWIPTEHVLCYGRAIFLLMMCLTVTKEFYELLENECV